MAIYKKIEITIETERSVTIRRRSSLRAWCAECGAEVEMVSLAEARRLMQSTLPTLSDSAEARNWHISEQQGGTLLVCLASLRNSLYSA
jgi:hypothetical protein